MPLRSSPKELTNSECSTRTSGEIPHHYADTWTREATSGPDRIIIGALSSQTQLMSRLADVVAEPLLILYVLTVPRSENEPGPYPLEREARREFLTSFAEFLERDGRHDFWLASPDGSATLVYDKHNVLYGYGPLDAFERVLEEAHRGTSGDSRPARSLLPRGIR